MRYSTLWSETFTDAPFRDKLTQWLREGDVSHDLSHVRPFDPAAVTGDALHVAKIAADLRRRKSIMGVFDAGCMGMFNANHPR